jgi:GT2 family glycosyltransferase
MPVYQAAATLPAVLDDLAAQTLADWELVAVDDGSTDGSRELLSDRACRDARIRLLSRTHAGITEALNAGLAVARAPLVARMDADDRMTPDRLAVQVAAAAAHPDWTVVGCRVTMFPEEALTDGMRHYRDWLDSVVSPAEIARDLWVESPLPHPSVLFRRADVQAFGGYRDGPFPEDYDLWLRLHTAGRRMGKVDAVLVSWREGAERLSRSDPRYGPGAFRALKAHHLARSVLAGRAEVQLWGAGPDARAWRNALAVEGIRVARFFDVDPRKIGRTLGDGAPVLDWRETPRFASTPILCAVGQKGARERMRRMLADLAFVEGRDFWCVQ